MASTDFLHLAVLAVHIGLLSWTFFYALAFPLILLFKPDIGVIFSLPLIWTIYDKNTPRTGGRKSKWFQNLAIFNTFRDYFPTRLIKTANLPAGRNYILAHYPHAVVPFNILPNFLSDCNKVSELFPQIEMQFLSHDTIFFVPIVRDFFLALGGCSCAEDSFRYLLNGPSSKGIIVTPGAAEELSYAKPGNVYKIIKSKRKGFVRLALSTGTPLVPVFTFGEINVWNKLVTIPTRWIYNRLHRGCPDVFITIGRGFIFRNFGFLPKKAPVNTVVGEPIPVPRVENPSQDLIDEYHEKFFQALFELFEKYKHEYDAASSQAKLIMI